MTNSRQSPDFAKMVHGFFCDRLINQQNVSPNTVAAYRDTFRLLLDFLNRRRHRPADELTLDDIDAPMVLAFLNDLEASRGNAVRTRNARLAAIRAFVSYASTCDPTALSLAQRVRAIPSKRHDRPLLGYLTRTQIEALLEAPDRNTWSGRRDRVLFTLMYNTGTRVSEAIGLSRADVSTGSMASVRIRGKGRKERSVPLWKRTAALVTSWLTEIASADNTPLFPNRQGRPMSRSGVEERLQQAVITMVKRCPSLRTKNISPHTLRHTTAMHLLQAGVDVTVIALWLGHESPETTHLYVEADLDLKRRVLDRLDAPPVKKGQRFRKPDLLNFLDGL